MTNHLYYGDNGEVLRSGNGNAATFRFAMRVQACAWTQRISVLFSVVLVAAATAVSAQNMRPLCEVLDKSASPYPPTRCAGLYQGLMEWTGELRMGVNTFATMDQARRSLIMLAVLASRENGLTGTDQHGVEVVLRDVRNVPDLYLSRFEANYAEQGEAFGSDHLLKSDMALCKGLLKLPTQ